LPDQPPTVSFQLPEGRSVDVFLVRLPDGRIVARTREELAELPAALRERIQPVTAPPRS